MKRLALIRNTRLQEDNGTLIVEYYKSITGVSQVYHKTSGTIGGYRAEMIKIDVGSSKKACYWCGDGHVTGAECRRAPS